MAEMEDPGRQQNDPLDALLKRNFGPPHADASEAESLTPSSGFAEGVMERVRAEARAPEPIRFPWRRAVPGVCMAVLAVAVAVTLLVVALTTAGRLVAATVFASATSGTSSGWGQMAAQMHAGWLLAGLMVALIPLGLTRVWSAGHR